MEKTTLPLPHRNKVKSTVKHDQNKLYCFKSLKQTTIFKDNSENFFNYLAHLKKRKTSQQSFKEPQKRKDLIFFYFL